MRYEKLTQRHRIVAELYAYSLANYSDHALHPPYARERRPARTRSERRLGCPEDRQGIGYES